MAKVEDEVPGAGAGLTLAPAGRPVTLKVTVPVKPFSGFMVIVYSAVVVPCTADCVDVTDKLKSGAATTSVAPTECWRVPLVPVIVSE